MKKPLLHIIPYIPEYEDKIREINKDELDNAGFWYLHGSLEEMFKYDKAVMTNCKTLGLLKQFVYDEKEKPIGKLYYNGEIECEVEGCDKPCIAFLYTINESGNHWTQKGLVCLKEDKRDCDYARKKMIEKRIIL